MSYQSDFIVAEAFKTSDRGTAVLLAGEPEPQIPPGEVAVAITRPDGKTLRMSATSEYVLIKPGNEQQSFLFPGTEVVDLPQGTRIDIFE